MRIRNTTIWCRYPNVSRYPCHARIATACSCVSHRAIVRHVDRTRYVRRRSQSRALLSVSSVFFICYVPMHVGGAYLQARPTRPHDARDVHAPAPSRDGLCTPSVQFFCPLTKWSAKSLRMSTIILDADGQPAAQPRKEQCANFTRAEPVIALPPRKMAECRVAAGFFGALARYWKAASTEDLWLTLQLAQPSFIERIVRSNPVCTFDVFLHTWNSQFEKPLMQTFRPRAAAFGALPGRNVSKAAPYLGWPGSSTPAMWASIQRVLELKREAELQDGLLYTWVLLLRSDILWMARFSFDVLNDGLLYLGHACSWENANAPNRTSEPVCRSLMPTTTSATDVSLHSNARTY